MVGRPKKNPEPDLSELIKKITAEVTADLEKKYKDKIKEIENIKPKAKKYKYIPDSTKVRIQSNIGGIFVFQEDRGKVRVFVQLDGHGDTAVISYEELRAMHAIKPNFLKSGKLAITDVYSNEGIELEDVLVDLRVDNLYLDEKSINPKNIVDIFSDEVAPNDFEKLLNNTPEIAETVLENAYILYRRGQFNDNSKMNYLRQIFNNTELFKV
jgi:DUF2075 family protein